MGLVVACASGIAHIFGSSTAMAWSILLSYYDLRHEDTHSCCFCLAYVTSILLNLYQYQLGVIIGLAYVTPFLLNLYQHKLGVITGFFNLLALG